MKTLDNVKHPLGSEWSFWLFTNQKKNWADNLVKLATFDTVEDYWCLYHHMKVPSELNLGQEYLVFKKGIQPQWEDPANQSGGRWLIILDGEKAAHVDAIWLDTVLVLIGETFEHVDDVCGVVCNIRAKHRIAVWMRNCKAKAVCEVGKKLREHIPIKMQYYRHNQTKALFTI
ncbi:eukaryotic translation initiation factor 4E1-like [Helicoverpa zea]|uniref:eukaryotic translation initiation factor 4E1-like n=1 Tax=Helicoverpa zea TaxID=7113 RepID=UPI001F565188|nr:eukaryotic translation initiation factor 4E1-like [Helicoverpa zea]XP_047020720.1 eukaryotic translation initiation factor 4E1-like [Helicoverpa zea]